MGRGLAFDRKEGADVEIVCCARDGELDSGVKVRVEKENKFVHQFYGLIRRMLFAAALDEENFR
jgi:hypothetical protein